jgi:hypothetical protein
MSREDGKISIDGRTYTVVTLDYETFYGKEFTLSGKINTSEYVRDDRFHVHGVSLKIGNGPVKWYTRAGIRKALDALDWANTALVAHNMAFDGFITSEVYDHVPAFYLDTLSMARATMGHHQRHNLDTVAKAFGRAGKTKAKALADTKDKMLLTPEEEKALGEYAADDVQDCYDIFWDMYPNMPDDELELVDITMRMFCDPVLEVDIPRVKAELENEIGQKAAALLKSGAQVDDLMSNDKFAALLQAAGATLPMKISPSTGKPAYAFAKSDLAFKELMQTGSPKVQALCEARLRVKSTIGETRAVRFLEAGKDGAKLPILLQFSGAHTHRWSGGNKMNLQNLKRGGELRRSILAPKGHKVIVADSAQIEARVLAWIAEQADIVNAFANKDDVYKLMASAIYGVPVDQVTKDQRFIGKICVLGLGYGMGPQKLQQTLKQGTMGPSVDIELEECQRIVTLYRQKNWKIKQFWRKMDAVITSMTLGVEGKEGPISYGKGFVRLPNGLFLQYFGLHGQAEIHRDDLVMTETTYLTRTGRTKLYGGLLAENLVQALARIIVAQQMLTIAKAGYTVVTMTHDEIVCVAKDEDAQGCLDFMLQTMSTAPDWAPGLPLSAEGDFDDCYSK